MLESRSALAHVLPAAGRDGADARRRLRLGEAVVGSLVQIGLYPGDLADAAARGAAEVLGAPLSESPVVATTSGPHVVLRIALDQWLVRTTDTTLARRLRAALAPQAASVLPLDQARTAIVVAGPAARDVLARLVAVDLDPDVFAVGHFAQTPIHHVGGLLLRLAADRYEFLALRTYAQDTWEVIEDAARAFGYDLVDSTSTSPRNSP